MKTYTTCFVLLAVLVCLVGAEPRSEAKSSHTNNWAVLVCASRYWFNYRHIANVLSMYRSVKRLGIPDSNIILMVADDMACNPRNPRPATVFNNANQQINVYGDDIEVDYRGYEVTVENFLRVLTGRLDSSVPRSKRLLSDDRSNILVYMTGHGGDGFLKFQDSEEISSIELADAFEQMWQKQRYNELLFLIDTCQAASMIQPFYSPNIVGSGSSSVSEDSLSHHLDNSIGVHIIDRWTYYALEFLERINSGSKATLKQFFDSFDPTLVRSTPQVRTSHFQRPLYKVLVTDFFGSVRTIELQNTTLTGLSDTPSTGGRGIDKEHGGRDDDEEWAGQNTPAYMLSSADILDVPEVNKTLSNNSYHYIVGIVLLVLITMAMLKGMYHLVGS